jgi:2,3-bisphosphoglycerate-independent phosphoglycerate mutase
MNSNMKFVIIIPDGCADEPQSSLDGRTPLQAARTPAMDQVAATGLVGSANHTPRHLPAGSDVANLSLLGYDPDEYYTGRAPLEAAAQGITLQPEDWAIRCNLVTVQDQIMKSFTAGQVSTAESKSLLLTAQEHVTDPPLQFATGVSYRNLLLYRPDAGRSAPFSRETRTTPPHDLTDKSINDDFPRGPGSQLLAALMSDSVSWFAGHPVNLARVASGHLPVTNIWLWGLGQQPDLPSFVETHGLKGAMITAVDLLRGLAKLIGWDRIEVPGATGYTDTDYRAKGEYAISALDRYDIVCVHVEATDEASHEGDVAKKVQALEDIDSKIVAPILEHLKTRQSYRLLITPDHPTYLRTKTHTHGDVPFAICGDNLQADDSYVYNETVAENSPIRFDRGWELMDYFIDKCRVTC